MRLILALSLAALSLGACNSMAKHRDTVANNGTGVQRDLPFTGFTQVDLTGPDDVDVASGSQFAVRVEGDPAILDHLDIRKEGDTLRIGRKDGYVAQNEEQHPIQIHVTLPRLTGARVDGSGDLTAARGDGDFTATIAGSGDLHVTGVSGGAVQLLLSGSGDLSIAGTASSVRSQLSGSGDIDATNLHVRQADFTLSGSGDTNATVSGPVVVSASGSGNAKIQGGARCTIRKTGTGDVECS